MVVLTSFSPPTEGIKHEQPGTKLFMSGREVGAGTLYIAESKLSWRNGLTGEGFSLLYPHIAVHAVSRDIERFGYECLYILLDTCLEELNMEEKENDDENEEDRDADRMTEMRFVPEDKGQLDAMYTAMTFCQSQHPDPQSELSEEDEFLDADEEGEYTLAGGDNQLNDIPSVEPNGWRHGDEDMETDGQFEDAEDED